MRRNTPTERDPDKLVTWSVPKFPRALKNKFLGVSKSQGLTGSALLEEVVADYLKAKASA